MWWIMLIARLLKKVFKSICLVFFLLWFLPTYIINKTCFNLRYYVATISTFHIYLNWFINPSKTKWKMKFAYPASWMILTAVMLNLQFIGIYYGTGWRNIIPLHLKQQAHDEFLEWFPKPPRKPPDPVRTVKLVVEDNYDDDSCSEFDDNLYDEISIHNNNIKYLINNVVYSVSKRAIKNSKEGTLIDRGANGGLAGNNVRVLHKTGRTVDVQGIDNHQIVDIPIVTAAGVVKSHRGDIILIMNQYAHIPNGKQYSLQLN